MTSFLYRGPLSSCNYGCTYCPFAKTKNTRSELQSDAQKLTRFTEWIALRNSPTSVFFTPWGEALIRQTYKDALQTLSHLPHLQVAAIQTNLSGPIDWIDTCDTSKIGLWATYHGDWCNTQEFIAKVHRAHQAGVRISVGVVGFPEQLAAIRSLRKRLSPDVYLWINAAKRSVTYSETQIQDFEAIDPQFRTNTLQHPSLGQACKAGSTVVSVDGDGNLRRCHFIGDSLGNIYEGSTAISEFSQACTNLSCGCHIGYVHLESLELSKIYGQGILERIPTLYSLKRPAPL